jgi:hypothetical protein
MHEFARVSRAIIHGAAKSKKLPDPSAKCKNRMLREKQTGL